MSAIQYVGSAMFCDFQAPAPATSSSAGVGISSAQSAAASVGGAQSMASTDLSSIGSELLKMAIALLILEVLLGEDEASSSSTLLAALGSNGEASAASFMISQTTTVQMQWSTDAYAGGEQAASASGGQIDVSA